MVNLVFIVVLSLFATCVHSQCCYNADCTGCNDPSTYCTLSQQNCVQDCHGIWCSGPTPPGPPTPGPTPPSPPEQRAMKIVSSMSNSEKFSMLNGVGWSNYNNDHGYYIGNTVPINTHQIPSLNMQDGPQGFRTTESSQYGQLTSWPCSLSVSSTWDPELMKKWGVAMGQEYRAKGANQILGPAINFHRVARGGRNGEYLTGEDPHLGSVMAANYISGVQSQKVMATTKHYFLNNQETNRDSVSSNVDDRTLHEIYLPPYEAAVKAGSASFMCSYNLVNGTHSCGNSYILKDILRNELGFNGWVMSDWWATHGTWCSQGLDQDQPGTDNFYSPGNLNQVDINLINQMVYRILLQMIIVGAFDDPVCVTGSGGCNNFLYGVTATNTEHATLARTIASNSAQLLSNSGVLPLDSLPAGSIIGVVGSACNSDYNLGAMESTWNLGNYYILGGSGRVINPNTVTILSGIQSRGKSLGYEVIYDGSNNIQNSIDLLKKANVGIICGATTSTEGNDRSNLYVDQDKFISSILSQKPSSVPVVVALQTPGVILTNWRVNASAIVNMFLAGQETGNAWADVLFGDVNPSGRLPVTFPLSDVDTISPCSGVNCDYTEGLFVGYRGMSKKEVAFPFGHGLSYTTFSYVWVTAPTTQGCDSGYLACMEFNVSNTGKRDGSEVAQIYLDFPSGSGEPPVQLRGFQKLSLPVNAVMNVKFGFSTRDLSIWNIATKKWQVVSGRFVAYVGASSRDLKLQGSFEVNSVKL